MHPNLSYSLDDLVASSERILEEAKRHRWKLHELVEQMDALAFQKFYRELIPFVEELRVADNDLIRSEVAIFLSNKQALYDAMQEKEWIFFTVLSDSWNTRNWREADELLRVISEIRDNAKNLTQLIRDHLIDK